jgi:hypothetical protein
MEGERGERRVIWKEEREKRREEMETWRDREGERGERR